MHGLIRFAPVLALGCLALTGCGRIRFTAYSAQSENLPRITREAVFVRSADVNSVVTAGAWTIGYIDARCKGECEDGRRRRAMLAKAAEHGGTHVVSSEGVVVAQTPSQTPQVVVVRQNPDGTYTTDVQNTVEPAKPKKGRFLVLRVEPSHWAQLPNWARPVAP